MLQPGTAGSGDVLPRNEVCLISSSLGKSRGIRSTCPVTHSSEADGDKVFLGSSNRFSAQASSQLALVVEHGYLSPLNHG